LLLVTLVLTTACGGGRGVSSLPPLSLGLGCGGLSQRVASAAIVIITVASGQTTISGTTNGAPFNTAATTFFIGHPDVTSTTVEAGELPR
jgi:hypothetical protein